MTTPYLPADREHEEARKLVGYLDSKGIPTAGVSHTGPDLHVGVHYSPAQVDTWLAADIAHVTAGLDKAIPWWRLSDVRQDVLASMAFQMGVAGLLKFTGTLSAVERGLYDVAASRMLAFVASASWSRLRSRVRSSALRRLRGGDNRIFNERGPMIAALLTLMTMAHVSAATPMLRAADMKPGVVVHIDAYGSPSREVEALRAIGVVRVRVDAPQPVYLAPGNGYDALCAAGIKITPFINGWVDPSSDGSPHAEFAATRLLEQRHPGCIEAIEGPNEVNNFPEHYHDLTGAAAAQAFQAALYARVKSDAVLKDKPVIGYTDIHPVDSPSDFANAHPYVGSWWQDLAIQKTAPLMPKTKNWVATEYGWSTPPRQTDRTVTAAVQAQRVLAGVAAMAAAGFNPAFLYELRDEGDSVDSEQHYGLFRKDWTPKPAATALGHLLAETRDVGERAATFQPEPLTVSISDARVRSLLLAKSDASYVLLFWMNKHLGDPPSTFDIALPTAHSVAQVDPGTGDVTTMGRQASFSGLTFRGNDSVGVLRISAN